jgi:EAL domain-containing protein (putative c-di-GMP-specific phosphodiesterase class I)
VNLFAAQFRAGDLFSVVEGVLAQTSLSPTALELEITENIILRNGLRINAMLGELREQGVGIAFDDYASLRETFHPFSQSKNELLLDSRQVSSDIVDANLALLALAAVSRDLG